MAEADVLLADAPSDELQPRGVIALVALAPQQGPRGLAVQAVDEAVRHSRLSRDGEVPAKLPRQPILERPPVPVLRLRPGAPHVVAHRNGPRGRLSEDTDARLLEQHVGPRLAAVARAVLPEAPDQSERWPAPGT